MLEEIEKFNILTVLLQEQNLLENGMSVRNRICGINEPEPFNFENDLAKLIEISQQQKNQIEVKNFFFIFAKKTTYTYIFYKYFTSSLLY